MQTHVEPSAAGIDKGTRDGKAVNILRTDIRTPTVLLRRLIDERLALTQNAVMNMVEVMTANEYQWVSARKQLLKLFADEQRFVNNAVTQFGDGMERKGQS